MSRRGRVPKTKKVLKEDDDFVPSYFVGDAEVRIFGDVLKLENIVASVKFPNGTIYDVPVDFRFYDKRTVDPQKIIISTLISYFQHLRLVPRNKNDIECAKYFLYMSPIFNSFYGEEFHKVWADAGARKYGKELKEFEKKLDDILRELRTLGFTVDLLPNEVFSFKFVNRKKPLEVKVEKYTPVQEEALNLNDFNFNQFYGIKDVLDTAERSLKPVEGRRYMDSFLATWQEFRNIRYATGEITLERKKL